MANQIANTIYQQLGGKTFSLMTGARAFVAQGYALRFAIPRARGVNRVQVTYNPGPDTYTMLFSYVHAGKERLVKTIEDVYCDQLAEVFRNTTGLETRMPRITAA